MLLHTKLLATLHLYQCEMQSDRNNCTITLLFSVILVLHVSFTRYLCYFYKMYYFNKKYSCYFYKSYYFNKNVDNKEIFELPKRVHNKFTGYTNKALIVCGYRFYEYWKLTTGHQLQSVTTIIKSKVKVKKHKNFIVMANMYTIFFISLKLHH